MADMVAEIAVSEEKFRQQTRKVFDDALRATADFERQANAKLKDFGKGFANSEMTKAQAREFDRLKKQFDPLYAASKRYEGQLDRLNQAQKVGALSAKQYEAALETLNAEFSGAAPEMQRVGGASRAFGGQIQNAAFQVQDFAVQVAGGTSASKALAQQLPQLLGGLGIWGAVAGAAAAIAIPLGAAWLNAGEEAGTLEEQLDKLTDTTDAMIAATEKAQRPIHELRDAFGSLADEVSRADQAQAFFSAEIARRNLTGTAAAMSRDLFGGAFQSGQARPAGDFDDITARGLRIRKLADMLQVSTEEARAFEDALASLGDLSGPEEVLAVTEQLLTALSKSPEAAAKYASEIESLGALNREAARQIQAGVSETQKLLDKYGGTTRELRQLTDERAAAEKALAQAQKEGNTQLVADMNEVLVKLDAQIAKVKELAAESDISFGSLIERARSFVSALGQGIVDAVREGDDAAAQSGILALIRRRESAGDYNAQWGGGAYSGGAKDFVNMTVREVLAVQREMLRHPGNTANSSAVGAYQIVGTTLGGEKLDGTGGLVAKLQISLDEQFTPQLQDRLAQELLREARPGGVDRLRGVWTGLQGVPDAVIQGALGNEVVPRVDPEVEKAQAKVQSDRQKALEAETRERERQFEQARQYGEQLIATLVTEQQRAELERQRSEAIAAITASDLSEGDKAAAIAEVNGEMQKQLTIMALMEEAKRRGVDLDARMIDSALTYRQAIEAVAEAQKQKVVTDQQVATSTAQVAERTQAAREVSDNFNRTLYDALMASDDLDDALRRLALSFVEMAAQALIMGQGPLATLLGISGGLFNFGGAAPAGAGGGGFGGFRAAGGPVSPSKAYVVGERGPEIFVPRLPGDIIPQGRGVASGSGGVATININLAGANGDRAIAEIARASVMQGLMEYDEALPGRVRQVKRDPRKLGRV